MDLTTVILQPVYTEKSNTASTKSKYTFLVPKAAHKIVVRQAVEMLYGVKVASVNMVAISHKTRLGRNRQPMHKRQLLKKAIVTLKGGKTIDVAKLPEKK